MLIAIGVVLIGLGIWVLIKTAKNRKRWWLKIPAALLLMFVGLGAFVGASQEHQKAKQAAEAKPVAVAKAEPVKEAKAPAAKPAEAKPVKAEQPVKQHRIPLELMSDNGPIGVSYEQATSGLISKMFKLEGRQTEFGNFTCTGDYMHGLCLVDMFGKYDNLNIITFILNNNGHKNYDYAKTVIGDTIWKVLPSWEHSSDWVVKTMDELAANGGGYKQLINDGVRLLVEYRVKERRYFFTINHE